MLRWSAFPIFFVGILLVSSILVAILSGWFRLADQFRAFDEIDGRRFRFSSGRISRWKNASLWFPAGGIGFNNILKVTLNGRGFGLGVFFPFSIFMRPIFIPWSAVDSIRSERFLWKNFASIMLANDLGRIDLTGAPGRALLSSCPAQLIKPTQ
ncbi:hypothetical protein DYH55_17960 [Methylovirgula sp. 4M-Z18]|nr:hypothetical protein DYH55_17960 [Methylovirgula sp. 4M-Z18]